MRNQMKAVVVEKIDGKILPRIGQLPTSHLPEGEVLLRVTHTALNYSDGAYMFGKFGEPPRFPHVPGIDFVGVVEKSSHPGVARGKTFMHTSYGVGYERWGGMAEYAVSNGSWLIEKPAHLSDVSMMGLGTVGLTAILAIEGLERNGLNPSKGHVLVTGASGGVGSMAVLLLSKLGYRVTASSGKREAMDYLRSLGATDCVSPAELETTNRQWAGAIDSVAGKVLKNVIDRTSYSGTVAVTGVASGFGFELDNVSPFVMNAVSIVGVNTVMWPEAARRSAWKRVFGLMTNEALLISTRLAKFDELPRLGAEILKGGLTGRIVVPIGETS
jgi:acrylyl-CoA reductase (NADPH)